MEADESSINDIFEPNCSVITGNQDIQQVPISIFPGLSSYMKNPLFKNQFQHFVNRFSEIDITTTARESGTSLALKSGDTAIKKTNIGNTKFIMTILSEMWLLHMVFILGGVYFMTFYLDQNYTDEHLWTHSTWFKIGALLPFPYTVICFLGLVFPFRLPRFLYTKDTTKRRIDNLYILTVTKGANKEAVYRSWNAHKHLELLHSSIRVHVLTDEPHYFDKINCYTCPKNFATKNSMHKARALEWYRQTMKFTELDWILHLDEESVIDDESVRAVLNFIWYEKDCHWGQGIILYNQYKYWSNWLFTVADALRVGDDISRFSLQYTYLKRPFFGAHGSFLLTNGLVENTITWDLGSLTEDYQFAMHAWDKGFKCGKVSGIIREQSPQNVVDFMRQRRRWFAGIIRLPNILPKIWGLLWIMGSLALYGTVISIAYSIYLRDATPRWFGILKDFTFCTFVYLYILGIVVQDIDKGVNPILIILHIPLTFVLQFVAAILESLSVLYGILSPPKGFDIIKK